MGKMKELYTIAQETQIDSTIDGPLSDGDILDALWAIRRLTWTQDGTHACATEAHDLIHKVACGTADRLLDRMYDKAITAARKALTGA